MGQQNKISFTVNNIPSKKNHAIDGMIALKKIQHFSYALSDEIGLGYSSHVYKGKNDKTNELVAVKVIDIKKEDDLHRQFTNDEVNILEKIKTVNAQYLLKLQGVFKTKNNLYIITQFCEGKDLAKILRKKKYFNQPEAQGIMKQFLKGYGELYRLKVVHRDLKLANIFIKRGKAVLADFGFAIDADRCTQKFDYNVGSPFYMPPQSLKFNRYSFKSDVWAIGIIAFELIFGHRPWKDKDDDILFDKITNTVIDELFDPNVQVSEPYKQFIRECLRIDFDRRATPQFVINYEWSKAIDYIDGMVDENPYHHPKNVSLSKLPHNIHPVTTKNVSIKQIHFEDIRQNKFIKNQNTQAPFSLMPVRQMSPHKENLLARKKNISSDNIIQNSSFSAKKQSPYEFQYENMLKRRTQRQNTVDYPFKQLLSEGDSEKTIIAQIHFCRFLNLVYDSIEGSRMLDQLKQLSDRVQRKILDKIEFLSRLQNEQQNQLIPGLKVYTASPRWKRLCQMINDYRVKYSAKFNYTASFQGINSETVFLNLQKIKTRIGQGSNERVIQLLMYLYQVLQLQENNSLFQFYRQSKIEYLAENRNLTYSAANTQRLLRKLEYLQI